MAAAKYRPKQRRVARSNKRQVIQRKVIKRERVSDPPKPPPKMERPRVHISDQLRDLARARTAPKFQAFTMPEFPPGVLPNGNTTLAADQSINDLFGWAGNALMTGGFWEGLAFMGFPYLAELAQRPEYRRLSGRIATELTRKWIKITSTGDDDKTEKIKKIEDEFKRLKVKDVFCKAAGHDGFFGRGHIHLDFGTGLDSDELKVPIGDGKDKVSTAKVGTKKPLVRLQNVEPSWVYPQQYNATDPLAPDFYKPQSWGVFAREVHSSRLLTLISREVPDMLKPAYAFAGLSMSQMAKPYVDNWLRTRQSVSDIIAAFSTFVLKTNMQTTTQPGGDDLLKRLDMFNMLRTNSGVWALDKETEDFVNVAAPLGSLDKLQAQAQEQMAAVGAMPLIILLGISPAGLNASSEGEIRVWYDYINAEQPGLFDEALTRVLNFVQLSLFGEVDDEIVYTWEKLWSLSEKEQAEVQKTEADTDAVYLDAGVIHPVESRKRLADDPDAPYKGLDVEDVPEPPQDEGAGGIGGGQFGEQNNPPAYEQEGTDNENSKLPQKKKGAGGSNVVPFARDEWWDGLLGQDFNPYHEGKGARTGGRFAHGQGGGGQSARRQIGIEGPGGEHKKQITDPGSEVEGFVSPNTGNLTFEQATLALRSRRQKVLARAAQDINRKLGIKATATPVIGAWADGAENSMMEEMPGVDHDKAKVALAMMGWLANQKQVLEFEPGDGNDFMASFDARGGIGDVHADLLKKGLAFHTIQPHEGGARVIVFGQDQDTMDAVAKAALYYDTKAKFHTGKGEFIGTQKQDGTDTEQRADARKAYENVIGRAGGASGRDYRAAWDGIRDRWGSALQEPIAHDTNPYHHPAGDPRGGQFAHAPQIGGEAMARARADAIKGRAILAEATLVARDLGYDAAKIHINPGDYQFTLNGRNSHAAGLAHLETGDIELFPSGMRVEETAGVTAHEIMHQKYQTVLNLYRKQYNMVMEKSIGNNLMRHDGLLKPPYDKEFPIYQKMTEASMPSMQEFALHDGVSGYSYAWWKEFLTGKASTDAAMHETLAEMAKIKYETGEFPNHMGQTIISWRDKMRGRGEDVPDRQPTDAERDHGARIWRKLYRTVEELYAQYGPQPIMRAAE